MFSGSAIDLMFGLAFTVLLAVAAALDLRYRRIPNVLALGILVLGALFETVVAGSRDAAIRVVEGAGIGLLVWLPFWALGKLGAGDVKFFAAACAWLGPRAAIDAALLSALCGGVLALFWLWTARARCAADAESDGDVVVLHDGSDGMRDGRRDASTKTDTVPYGVAMAVGLAITAWFPHLLH